MTKEEMILKLIGDGYLIEQVWAKDFRELGARAADENPIEGKEETKCAKVQKTKE